MKITYGVFFKTLWRLIIQDVYVWKGLFCMRMRQSIRKSVWIRIILATLSILVFCVAVNISAFHVRSTQTAMTRSNSLLDQAQSAKSAHYKWCSCWAIPFMPGLNSQAAWMTKPVIWDSGSTVIPERMTQQSRASVKSCGRFIKRFTSRPRMCWSCWKATLRLHRAITTRPFKLMSIPL